jgi:hypothetical protein
MLGSEVDDMLEGDDVEKISSVSSAARAIVSEENVLVKTTAKSEPVYGRPGFPQESLSCK